MTLQKLIISGWITVYIQSTQYMCSPNHKHYINYTYYLHFLQILGCLCNVYILVGKNLLSGVYYWYLVYWRHNNYIMNFIRAIAIFDLTLFNVHVYTPFLQNVFVRLLNSKVKPIYCLHFVWESESLSISIAKKPC